MTPQTVKSSSSSLTIGDPPSMRLGSTARADFQSYFDKSTACSRILPPSLVSVQNILTVLSVLSSYFVNSVLVQGLRDNFRAPHHSAANRLLFWRGFYGYGFRHVIGHRVPGMYVYGRGGNNTHDDAQRLRNEARELRHTWRNTRNVSVLLRSLAQREILLVQNNPPKATAWN